MNAIETHALTRVFGKTRAVDAASLAVPAGTVFGLLGANGAGKSTLLKLLTGHLRPTNGTISVLGEAVSGPRPALWERMGYVAQSRYLPGWMTGIECLRFAGALHRGWDGGKAEGLARRLDFPLNARIRDLSRGHYVRLQIALAMGHNPELILLDEPTSGLDPVGRHELLGILVEEIGRRGCTVVISSHLVEDIERLADTVAIMEAGRIVACGPVDTVKSEAANGAATVSLEQAFFTYINRRQS
ncbi:MAG TPA: ABC transporter ATP-binding protein [Bryobacteraceae bacterium]|jgi:ABC-2 type transport system ATP-binding protein|nr:ABC transporter ATP-binding protein [Bryobacteraceae bacterium]